MNLSPHALLLLLLQVVPVSAISPDWVRTIEDQPGRLELELRPPLPDIHPTGSGGLTRLSCLGCQAAQVPGAPDLPFYRFDIVSGTRLPQIALHILESETRSLPAGILSVPFQPTPSSLEYRPVPALFRAAEVLSARQTGIRRLRGAPLRGIEIPLAIWNEETRILTLIRRLRVEIIFPDLGPGAFAGNLPSAFVSEIKNPIGGAWLYDGAVPRLPRRAASMVQPAGWPGERFIRIRVGDKTVESLAEDQVYALSFEEVSRISTDIRGGIRIDSLRLYTGNNDTLLRRMDTLPMEPTGMKGMLREIPMAVLDDGDGTFDEGDTLKFFAHGTSTWKRIPGTSGPIRYEFTIDPYSFENYYYLGFARQRYSGPSQRMPGDPGLKPGPVQEDSPHYLRAEQDRETASCDPSNHKDEETGFAWFWHWKGRCETYSDTTITLSRGNLESPETGTLTDLIQEGTTDSVFVGLYVYGQDKNQDYFRLYFGGGQVSVPLAATSHQSAGRYYVVTGSWQGMPALRIDSVAWSGSEKRFEGYTVRYRRRHVFRESPLWIFPEKTGVKQSYRVQGGAGATCLRVVDGVAVRKFRIDAQEIFTDSLPADEDARYFIYRHAARLPEGSITDDALPANGTAIRNLLDGDGENPEYLIVTARDLQEQAAGLKAYRNEVKRALFVRTSVVHVEDIYRQFGSGRMSPVAIRDFLRWAYHRWNAGGPASSPLKYVVLFGDGHYDYRGIHASRKSNAPPNFVPPYEFIVESGREEVATDDFYGNLDPGENEISEALLDIAIGRIPVQTTSQAAGYLEKIKAYENPALAGEWRARVVLTADDHMQRGANNDLDPITGGHTNDTEKLGEAMTGSESGLNIDRIYLLDYPINSSFHKPEAAQDLIGLINRGSLVTNYVGHGSSNQWADEVLLQTSDGLSRFQNRGRTGLINSFSCTVGRFESLNSEGMSEQFLKQAGVGTIGSISATRESYPHPNIALATAIYSRIFHRDTATGKATTVGEALMQAKNSPATNDILNNMKYALLGEPVLLLRKPLLKVTFTQAPDTLRALDCSSIQGTIAGGSGKGFINVKVVAGSVRKDYDLPYPMLPQFAQKRGSIMFERTFPYQDGRFSTEYLLPRQISFGDTNARITAFAWDAEREMEGSLSVEDLHIQGTAGTCPADTNGRGPVIRITGCEKKETGAVDFPDRVRLPLPYCLQIQVADSVGGVLSAAGPDEGTTVEVPGVLDPFHPQPGTDELNIKDYRLSFERKDFSPGSYLLKVSAQDGYGNISRRSLRMDLTLDSSISTITAYNVPNPVKRSGTAFYFSTILPQEEVVVGSGGLAFPERVNFEVRIFNQAGQVVKVLREARPGIRWDGRDEWGNRLANGVYFYAVNARWDQGLGTSASSYRTLSTKRNTLVLSR